MRSKELSDQLRRTLPAYTDKFSNTYSISSLSFVAGTGTITTSETHDIEDAENFILLGAYYPNTVASVAVYGESYQNRYLLTTDNQYDIDSDTITLGGNTEYEGTFDIYSRPSSTEIVYESSEDYSGNVTGLYLREDNVKGVYTATAVTDTTIEFSLGSSLTFDAILDSATVCNYDARITPDVDIDKAILAYTNQDMSDYWAFVVTDLASISKNSGVNNDAINRVEFGDAYQQELTERSVVYVIIPTQDYVSAYAAKDYCQNELRSYMIKCLCGYQPTSVFDNQYSFVYYTGDAQVTYNKSFYVHQYQFEVSVNITIGDAYTPESVPLRVVNYIGSDEKYKQVITEDTVRF